MSGPVTIILFVVVRSTGVVYTLAHDHAIPEETD
jgi:hypothetical protein